jgi:hypothetical protein
MKTSENSNGWELIIDDHSGNIATYKAKNRVILEKILVDLKLPDKIETKIKKINKKH